MNPYKKDAKLFIERALSSINRQSELPEIINGLTQLAFGFERVFKGILYDVNPVYVLQDESFKNSAAIFYTDKFSPEGSKLKKIISGDPNGDVISFRIAFSRACLFSDQIIKCRGILMALNNMRDIIAHRPLSELDEAKCRNLLLGDALTVLQALNAEGHFDLSFLTGDRLSEIELIAIDYTEDIDARIEQRIEHHRERYAQKLRATPQFNEAIQAIYTQNTSLDIFAGYLTKCPACSNNAEVDTDVEFEVIDGEAIPVAVFVSGFHCRFCDLEVSDDQEIDKMGVSMETVYMIMDASSIRC